MNKKVHNKSVSDYILPLVVFVIASVIPLIISIASLNHSVKNDYRINNLEIAKIAVFENDVSIQTVNSGECLTQDENKCDRVDIKLRNVGNSTANNIKINTYNCDLSNGYNYPNEYNDTRCQKIFNNTELVSDLVPGGIATFGINDISHRAKGLKIALIITIEYFDELLQQYQHHLLAFQYTVGSPTNDSETTNVRNLTTDDYIGSVCQEIRSSIYSLSDDAFLYKLPSCK